MNRHLKCRRGKNEKMLKCDDESPFDMPARFILTFGYFFIFSTRAYQVAIHDHIWVFFHFFYASILNGDASSHLSIFPFFPRFIIAFEHFFIFFTRAFQMPIHHHIWAFFHFFHAGISNGDSWSHLSIFSFFPRGHFKWRFIITFEHFAFFPRGHFK